MLVPSKGIGTFSMLRSVFSTHLWSIQGWGVVMCFGDSSVHVLGSIWNVCLCMEGEWGMLGEGQITALLSKRLSEDV